MLPEEIRAEDRIEEGEEFRFERIGKGDYRLTRCQTHENSGLVDWLLSCPEKNYFVPIQSESTDTL